MPNLSEAHIKAFGSLTYQYAQVEANLQKCLAGMLDVNPKVAIIVSAPYGIVDLRRVVKSVAKEMDWPDEQTLEKLMQIIGDSKPASRLRNNVAHSQWVDGLRPGSIKPIGLDIRNENARLYGHVEEEQDWTAEEIEGEATKLRELCRRIVEFAQDTGIAANIARHIIRAREADSASSGNSTNDSEN
jgi:hypothetical protein